MLFGKSLNEHKNDLQLFRRIAILNSKTPATPRPSAKKTAAVPPAATIDSGGGGAEASSPCNVEVADNAV